MKKLILALLLCIPSISHATLIGYNANFMDNGLITTEYRDDGTVWEWLDLTVTNGISFNSLQIDLSDDGIINNSHGYIVDGPGNTDLNPVALAGIENLSLEQASGWNTVSLEGMVTLVNSFFGIGLESVIAPIDLTLAKSFVNTFGNSRQNGFEENGLVVCCDIHQSRGFTNTPDPDSFNYIETVDVGYVGSRSTGYVYIGDSEISNRPSITYSTWLARQVVPVGEPPISILLLLGFVGMIIRRNQKKSLESFRNGLDPRDQNTPFFEAF